MEKILRKANIWDLHIHTPLGTPTKKNYGDVSAEEFIDAIIDIYDKAENKIGMISFTDHNKINVDAYEIFMKKSEIAIIPGIEVDVYLSEKDKDSKHIIFYFDETELTNIRQLYISIIIVQRMNSTQQSKNLRMCNITMYVRILITITKRLMRHATGLHNPCGRN